MDAQGSFVWYEFMAPDLDAALAFYPPLLGWTVAEAGGADHRYVIASAADGEGVAGLMSTPPKALENGAPSGWLGYVAVDDVDAAADAVAAAGGRVHHGPDDIPGVGRFASVADPQGAGFVLFRGVSEMEGMAYRMGAPGHGGWHELQCGDAEAALAFYHGLFGWDEAAQLDMGEMETYRLIAPSGGDPFGGMMNSPNAPRPMWLFYFNVPDIDAAARSLAALGGMVLFGPSEVPGGAWIVQATDTQGALFALVGPRTT